MTTTDEFLEEHKLIYQCDNVPGISREGNAGAFRYVNHKGETIKDEKTLLRIKKLVIPPAWTGVWISSKTNAHLQATGTDSAGRKQYKYHPLWSTKRNETKFSRLLELGKSLTKFRRTLKKDLRRRRMDMRKVMAIAVSFMEKTNIRVGNSAYRKTYGTYGLSTLRDRHVKIENSRIRLSYKGKKGIYHDVSVTDRMLSRLVKKCRDIPGQELFQYLDDEGNRHPIDSGMINSYIRELSGSDFTAKDLRTWAGTVEALIALSNVEPGETKKAMKENLIDILDVVSKKLGNTRAVCKKYYVYPSLLEAFESGSLDKSVSKLRKMAKSEASVVRKQAEKLLLSFLKTCQC